MVELQSLTRRFQDYVERELGLQFPSEQGWELTRKAIANSQRPKSQSVDFRLKSKDTGEQIVAEAKCVRRLTPQYVQQIDSYMKVNNVRKAFVFVASDTQISRPVREYARASNIYMEWTHFKATSRDLRYPWKL